MWDFSPIMTPFLLVVTKKLNLDLVPWWIVMANAE